MDQLESFFAFNSKMHNLLSSLAFDESKGIDESSIIKYADELYEALKYMHSEFKKISNEVYRINGIDEVFKTYYEEFLKCKYTKEDFKNYYQKYFSNMRLDFVNAVKANSCGYSMSSDATFLINPGVSINEMLHAIHSSILNNEYFYQKAPLFGFKATSNDAPINYRGNLNNMFASQLYTYFPDSIDCGITEIVAFENKTIIMLRDLGHATTLEIDELKDGKVGVHYFIPKLCNIDMINALPGIHKVSPDAHVHSGARGYFEVPKEEALTYIYNFLEKVPTDSNLIIR